MLLVGQQCAAALERARLHDRARADAERLALILEATQDGVWEWELHTGITLLSAHWKAMLGYAEHEVPDTFEAWSTRVHPEDWPQVETAWERHLAGHTPVYTSEHRLCHRDGTWLWVRTRGLAVRD